MVNQGLKENQDLKGTRDKLVNVVRRAIHLSIATLLKNNLKRYEVQLGLKALLDLVAVQVVQVVVSIYLNTHSKQI